MNGNKIMGKLKEQMLQSSRQAIPFHDYMELCLYDPDVGYYMQNRQKLGKEGDFYTSAHIGSLMGETIAAFVSRSVEQFGWEQEVELIEWGAGEGRMAKQVLEELRALNPGLYQRIQFVAIERSPAHQQLIRTNLREHMELGVARALEPSVWAADAKLTGRPQIVYCNELLDAFAVHLLKGVEGEWHEVYVGLTPDGEELREQSYAVSNPAIVDFLRRFPVTPKEGRYIELNLHALSWLEQLYQIMNEGLLVIIDYGDVSEELYDDHRWKGTLVAYRDHQASDRLLENPGEQDLTAHVNFTALMQESERLGFQVAQYGTQKRFLVENGLLEKLQDHHGDPFGPIAKRNRAIRQLLLSDQMSELFKVLVLRKPEGRADH